MMSNSPKNGRLAYLVVVVVVESILKKEHHKPEYFMYNKKRHKIHFTL